MHKVKNEKIIRYFLITAVLALSLVLLLFCVRAFAPFVFAFVIAAAAQRLVRFLEKRIKISRSVSSAALVTLIVAVTTALIIAAAIKLFGQLGGLFASLPAALDSLNMRITELSEQYNGFKSRLPKEIIGITDSAIVSLRNYLGNLSKPFATGAINAAKNVAAALPSIGIFLIMFILGTFFFTKDYNLIINFLREILPKRVLEILVKIKAQLSHAFSSYLKAQLILMLITMLLTTVCLWITGFEYPMVWGLLCGAVDILPLLGTASVLIPWALISLIYGDMYSFTALLIIQSLVFIVRQLCEPKVVSKQIGIHPILTLVSVYAGLKYFGIPGAVAAPLIMMLAVNLYVSYREGV